MKIDGVKFKQKYCPAIPLFSSFTGKPIRKGLVNMRGVAYVNGKEVCEA